MTTRLLHKSPFSMKQRCRLFGAIVTLTAMLCISLDTVSAEPLLKPNLNTIFPPLLADPTEPRIAVMPWLGERSLQLDIGASTDLYQSDSKKFAAGVDFGTFSLLHRKQNFKFPVDAIDYQFGINASWRKEIHNDALPFDEFSARARLSHISAHFEDGHYDVGRQKWIQGDCPFPIPFTYSREFINLVVAMSSPNHRLYAGYQYLYHSIPDGINPHSFQAGAELFLSKSSYIAADFKLLPLWQSSLNESKGYRGTWNLQAGRRLDFIGLESVRLAYNYYSGMSRHGMYFYHPESFSTIGVIVDI